MLECAGRGGVFELTHTQSVQRCISCSPASAKGGGTAEMPYSSIRLSPQNHLGWKTPPGSWTCAWCPPCHPAQTLSAPCTVPWAPAGLGLQTCLAPPQCLTTLSAETVPASAAPCRTALSVKQLLFPFYLWVGVLCLPAG